ncbi:MAG: hypothetical protein ACYDH5_12855 [Acidimicrobiales bacterium]
MPPTARPVGLQAPWPALCTVPVGPPKGVNGAGPGRGGVPVPAAWPVVAGATVVVVVEALVGVVVTGGADVVGSTDTVGGAAVVGERAVESSPPRLVPHDARRRRLVAPSIATRTLAAVTGR